MRRTPISTPSEAQSGGGRSASVAHETAAGLAQSSRWSGAGAAAPAGGGGAAASQTHNRWSTPPEATRMDRRPRSGTWALRSVSAVTGPRCACGATVAGVASSSESESERGSRQCATVPSR